MAEQQLVRYEAARAALTEAVRVDEVMQIRQQAAAFEAYARQAKDTELIDKATELKLRAERRAGQLLIAMEQTGERSAGGRPRAKAKDENPRSETTVSEEPKTLDDLGISKDQSSKWQGIARLKDQEFEDRVDQAKRGARASVEMSRLERQEAKKERRQIREQELSAKIAALPNKRFGVVYVDPPWSFEPYSRETGMDRAADNHYPTKSLQQIQDLDVKSIAAADCVLFLWATVPMLPEALDVMEHDWGFTYRSHIAWVKDRQGTGYWFRNKHELLLVGTKGDVPAPAPGTQWPSVIEAALGEHSEKPEVFLDMIEEYFPNLPKIELYRRGDARNGWSAWGNEVE